MTPRPENQPFADWLADAMKRHDLKQSAVARRMWGDGEDGGARNRDRLGHYQRGTSYPNPENRQKLADVFGVPLAEVPMKLPGKPTRARAAMSDETNVLDYLRAQFTRMDNRFDAIESKLDEFLATPRIEHHDQNLDVVLLRLLDRVHRYEDQIRALEDTQRRFDTRLRALEERE